MFPTSTNDVVVVSVRAKLTAVVELRTCEGDRCSSRAHTISKVTPVDR